jgi:hypothetical protein
MRHSFAIEPLGHGTGWFPPSRYRYYCVRCHWMFLVQGFAVCAVDDCSAPLPALENRRRTATFSIGPCPALSPECLTPPSGYRTNSGLAWFIDRLRRPGRLVPAARGPSSHQNLVLLKKSTHAHAANGAYYNTAHNGHAVAGEKYHHAGIGTAPYPTALNQHDVQRAEAPQPAGK